MKNGDITVCMVHHNTPEWLKVSLRRIIRHTGDPLKIVVVDNGSNAEASREAASVCKSYSATMIQTSGGSPGSAMDAAAATVTTRWMLSIDSDAFPVAHGWLSKIALKASDNVAAVGVPAGMARRENPFGNFAHPSVCLVNMPFLRSSGARFDGAWPRWDRGEQITIEAVRLGWQVEYLDVSRCGVFGHGVIVEDSIFHAYYGTQLPVSGLHELERLDGINAKQLHKEHRRLLDAEKCFAEEKGADPFLSLISREEIDMSIIVPFSRQDDNAVSNLRAVVASLNAQTLERNRYEIILVEAAKVPDVSRRPPKGCRAVFAYCTDPLFPKCWSLNVGFRHAHGRVLVFHDADILASDTMLEDVLGRISKTVPAVKPSYTVRNLNRDASEHVHKQGIEAVRHLSPECQHPRNAPGGSIAILRKHFEKIRGFNQKFVGWGGEDDEMLFRLRAVGSHPPDLECKLYHLWHKQESRDWEQTARNRHMVAHLRGIGRRVKNYIESMPEGFGAANLYRRPTPVSWRSKTGTTVLIAGAYSRSGPDTNAGDDAARDALVAMFRRRRCDVRISPKHPCTANYLNGVDLVVVGGGGIISDHSEDAFYNYMSYLKHCALSNIPVALLGVGICSLKHKRHRMSSLIRGAGAVCVRDVLSQQHLEDGKFATVAADLAWMLKPANIVRSERGLAAVFLVGNSYADSKAYRDSVDDRVDNLVQEDLAPVLIIHAKDDRRAVDIFVRKYKKAKIWDYFSSESNTPLAMVSFLAQMTKVVTSRYHGVIFSALAGVPCEVVSRSPEKVRFLRDEIGTNRLSDAGKLPHVVREMRGRARLNLEAVIPMLRKARTACRSAGRVSKDKVSVCMITLNDAAYIRRVLASIPRSSQIGEILAVDGGSSDETVAILKADERTRVLHRAFPNDFSNQKNFCLGQAKHDWVVWCDPDEMLPPEFWDSLDEMMMSGHEAFWFPRENFFGGAPSPVNDVGDDPDYQFRFFARKCRWLGAVHENLTGYNGELAKRDFLICHRKSRVRQQWNDQYYDWLQGNNEYRPGSEKRIERIP